MGISLSGQRPIFSIHPRGRSSRSVQPAARDWRSSPRPASKHWQLRKTLRRRGSGQQPRAAGRACLIVGKVSRAPGSRRRRTRGTSCWLSRSAKRSTISAGFSAPSTPTTFSTGSSAASASENEKSPRSKVQGHGRRNELGLKLRLERYFTLVTKLCLVTQLLETLLRVHGITRSALEAELRGYVAPSGAWDQVQADLRTPTPGNALLGLGLWTCDLDFCGDFGPWSLDSVSCNNALLWMSSRKRRCGA